MSGNDRPEAVPPRAVLLDAGNTLVFVDRDRIFEIFHEVGVEGDAERFDRAEFDARLRLSARVEETHTGTEPHVWQEYFVTLLLGAGVPEEALLRVGDRVREEHEREHLWTRVESGTAEALDRLSDAGFRLGVISNADGRVERVLERVGLRDRVEFVIDSHLIGFEKPDPRIFHEGVRRMALRAEECLYVGDLYPVDVVGARGAGLDAVLIDPSGAQDRPVRSVARVADLPAHLSPAAGLP